MNTQVSEHVLPRPVERLPEYAAARARQALAERLQEAFKLSEAAALAIASAVVDPSEVRKSIGDPADPQVEHIAVPGGTLLGIRTSAWTRRVMPDPRNPRLLPSRRHPFAVDPGTSGEDAKFRPVPEPRSPEGGSSQVAELVVEVENRYHLDWAVKQAAEFVLSENDWRPSIASQGVMEAVWLVATTYEHADGSTPVTALTTAEGSSRITSAHKLLSVLSAEVPYDENDARLRAQLRKLNDAYLRGPTSQDMIALRCERVPALLLVAFQPHTDGKTTFPTAVKSLVALRHVDPPKPWGEGPENESLADEVLDEVYRRGLISKIQRDYFAGACTKGEAAAAHLSADPAVRAAQIVHLFNNNDAEFQDAIRVAVTSQSTRKRITHGLCNELATALILRASTEDRERNDQIRRYLRHSFANAVRKEEWQGTDRNTEVLATAALQEVLTAEDIDDEPSSGPGPASLELAVRAAYPLVVSGRLNADRGTTGNDQPDRRTPGQVLDTMRRTSQGVHQLAQALRDFAGGSAIRAVNDDGSIKRVDDGTAEATVSDVYLRGEFPPPGKKRAPRVGDTPLDQYHNRVNDLAGAVANLEAVFEATLAVVGDDGQVLGDTQGVDPVQCSTWRRSFNRIEEQLILWSNVYRRKRGVRPGTTRKDAGVDDDDIQELAIDGSRDTLVEEWDSAGRPN